MQNEDAPPTSNPEQTLPEKNEIVENPKEKQINPKKRMKKKN